MLNGYVLFLISAYVLAIVLLPPFHTPKGYRAWRKLKTDWAIEESERINSGACIRCGGLVEHRHPSTKLNLTQIGLQFHCDRCVNWLKIG